MEDWIWSNSLDYESMSTSSLCFGAQQCFPAVQEPEIVPSHLVYISYQLSPHREMWVTHQHKCYRRWEAERSKWTLTEKKNIGSSSWNILIPLTEEGKKKRSSIQNREGSLDGAKGFSLGGSLFQIPENHRERNRVHITCIECVLGWFWVHWFSG